MTLQQLKEKYKNLNEKERLLLFFLIQWLYWAFAWWLYQKVWPDEKPWTFLYFLFNSLWMASCMTFIFKWRIIKNIFRYNKK